MVITDPGGMQTSAGEDGYQYQCVEFVRRFYREAVCSQKSCAVPPSQWNGEYVGYGNAQDFYPHASAFGLISFPNGATAPPSPDDIVGFSTAAGDLGHVAVVQGIDTSACAGATSAQFTVQLIEQNTSWAHQLKGQCQRQVGGNYTYTLTPRSLPIQGWLRAPSWLTFLEGNPGIPGDGIFVNASYSDYSWSFHPTPPIPLSQVTDGITFFIFPPPGTPNVQSINGGFDAIAPDKSGACQSGISSGFPITTFPTYTINGVQGAAISFSLATLEQIVAGSCDFTLNDLQITEIRVTAHTSGTQPIQQLDALGVVFANVTGRP
jgi:hypothetical protein